VHARVADGTFAIGDAILVNGTLRHYSLPVYAAAPFHPPDVRSGAISRNIRLALVGAKLQRERGDVLHACGAAARGKRRRHLFCIGVNTAPWARLPAATISALCGFSCTVAVILPSLGC